MKTHGVCHTKSARKHRKMGHATLRLPNGRHVWTSITSSIEVPTENGLLVGYNRKRARREGKRIDTPFDKPMITNDAINIKGKKPIDEEFPPPTINMLLKDTNGMMAGSLTSDLGEDYKKLLNETERHKRKKWPLMAHDIEIGAFYMPRKCNAATKPIEVIAITWNARIAANIVFFKNKDDKTDSVTEEVFLALVSRRVWL